MTMKYYVYTDTKGFGIHNSLTAARKAAYNAVKGPAKYDVVTISTSAYYGKGELGSVYALGAPVRPVIWHSNRTGKDYRLYREGTIETLR